MAPSARDLASQRAKLRREQESLLSELLNVVDALDRACEHWRTVEASQAQPSARSISRTVPTPLQGWLEKSLRFLQSRWLGSQGAESPAELAAISRSGREGDDLIRQTLLEVLERRNVKPIEVCGRPFDPDCMHALGRENSSSVPENTVLREVIRGYWWGDRVLRPAEVIVAVRATADG